MTSTNTDTSSPAVAPVRIGLLSASRIAADAILAPAAGVEGVEVVAVAARDLERAQQAAAAASIEHAYGSYRELLEADEVDAIYIANPPSLHREWTIAALEAGKHVLVEKPLAANAADAAAIRDVADAHDELVCMEAFHWRYHPLTDRWIEMVHSGQIGAVQRVAARFLQGIESNPPDDIRWDLAMGGGATMDLGCYAIQFVRAAVEPDGLTLGGAGLMPEVTDAIVMTPVDGVDGRLTASLRWESGVTAIIESSMMEVEPNPFADLRVVGTEGELYVSNPVHPSGWESGEGYIVMTRGDDREVIGLDDLPGGRRNTYHYQLTAFRDAVTTGAGFPSTMASGVTNMAIIDEFYRVSGIQPRPAIG